MHVANKMMQKLILSLAIIVSLLAGGFASIHDCHVLYKSESVAHLDHASESVGHKEAQSTGNVGSEVCIAIAIIVFMFVRKFLLKINILNRRPPLPQFSKIISFIRPPNFGFAFTHLQLGIIRI